MRQVPRAREQAQSETQKDRAHLHRLYYADKYVAVGVYERDGTTVTVDEANRLARVAMVAASSRASVSVRPVRRGARLGVRG